MQRRLWINIDRRNNNELWANNFLIGRGDENTRRNIENIINELPSDRIILRGLTDLNNALDIDGNTNELQNQLQNIIRNIGDRLYHTLTTCCPTQDTSIWD